MINGMHLNHPEPHPPPYPPPYRPWKNCHLQNWSIGDYQKDILLSVAKMKKKWMELFYTHTHTHTHTHTDTHTPLPTNHGFAWLWYFILCPGL